MFDPVLRMWLLVTVSAFLVVIVGWGLYWKLKIRTYDDFHVAGRDIPLFPLILTIVGTAIGGATVLGFMEQGYVYGISSVWTALPAWIIIAIMIPFLMTAIRNIGTKYKMVTIPDLTAFRFGEAARLPSLIAILCAYCAISGLQFVAIGTFLHILFGSSMALGIVIGWIILTGKTYMGGLKAVIWADSVQGSIQTIGIVVLFITVYRLVGGLAGAEIAASARGMSHLMDIGGMPLKQMLIYLATIGGYQLVRQDVWQRIWAGKTTRVALNAQWIALATGVASGLFVFFIGAFAKVGLGIEIEKTSLIFYEVTRTTLNPVMVTVVITALIATIVSCGDSFLVAGASSVVNDLFKPRFKAEDEGRLLVYSRYSVLVTSIFSLVLALYIPQLVQLWVTGTAMLSSALIVPVLGAFFWRRATKAGGVASIWGGLLIAVVWQLAHHPLGLHPVFVGIPTSLVLLIVVSLATPAVSPEVAEATYYFNNNKVVDGA